MEARALEVLGVEPNADWPTIRSAYRALARCFHPDGTAPDSVRMAEINAAYEWLERYRRRPPAVGRPRVAVGPGREPPRATPGSLLRRVEDAQLGETPVIDFGEYAGWRIADIARVDKRYLRWLSRHSSGIRYRAAIAEVLAGEPEIGRRASIVR